MSTNAAWLEAHFYFYRLLIKGKFHVYYFNLLRKSRFSNYIVKCVNSEDFTLGESRTTDNGDKIYVESAAQIPKILAVAGCWFWPKWFGCIWLNASLGVDSLRFSRLGMTYLS